MADVFRLVGAAISKMIVVTDRTRIIAPQLPPLAAILAPPLPVGVSEIQSKCFVGSMFYECGFIFQLESFLAHPTIIVCRLPGNATEKATVLMGPMR